MKTNDATTKNATLEVVKFETIQQWLNSKPSKEEQAKVLVMVNRKNNSALRDLWYHKRSDLNRLKKLQENLAKAGFKPNADVIEKIKVLEAEFIELTNQIGEPKKKVAKVVKPAPIVANTKEFEPETK